MISAARRLFRPQISLCNEYKTAFFFRRRTHSNVLTLWRGPRLSELYHCTYVLYSCIKSKSSQHEQISRKNSIASGSAKGGEPSAHLLSHFCQRAAIHIGSRLGCVCKSISLTFYKKRPSRNLEYIERKRKHGMSALGRRYPRTHQR